MSYEDISIQITFRNGFHVNIVFPKAQVLERCSGSSGTQVQIRCYLVMFFISHFQ